MAVPPPPSGSLPINNKRNMNNQNNRAMYGGSGQSNSYNNQKYLYNNNGQSYNGTNVQSNQRPSNNGYGYGQYSQSTTTLTNGGSGGNNNGGHVPPPPPQRPPPAKKIPNNHRQKPLPMNNNSHSQNGKHQTNNTYQQKMKPSHSAPNTVPNYPHNQHNPAVNQYAYAQNYTHNNPSVAFSTPNLLQMGNANQNNKVQINNRNKNGNNMNGKMNGNMNGNMNNGWGQHNNMNNPAAAYQQNVQNNVYGSQQNLYYAQQMSNMGSTSNLYGITAPSQQFLQQYGPAGVLQSQGVYSNTAYGYVSPNAPGQFYGNYATYPNQQNTNYLNGTQTPSNPNDPSKPSKSKPPGAPPGPPPGKHRKHSKSRRNKDGSKRKHRHRERNPDGTKKKRKHKHRSKDGKKRKKSKDKKKKSSKKGPVPGPPPGPPPMNGKNSGNLGVPGTQPGQPGSGNSFSDASEDDNSSSTSGSDSQALDDDPTMESASSVFGKLKNKKRKGKHDRFDSRNQFLRRRPVSGVPMSVQKQLNNKGTGDDKDNENMSSHLRLIHSKRCEKTKATVKFLKECLLKEVLFQGMDNKMIDEIVSVMYEVACPQNECIIRQNEYGDAYFVIQTGAFDIIHQEMDGAPAKVVGEMLPGKAFGEGSLLYSIPRAATLKATQPCLVWALDASKFLEIRQKISQQVNDKTSKIVRYLQKIDLFKKYHHQDLVALGQAVIERKYSKNAVIVKQGGEANEFFLIKTGSAIAVIKKNGKENTVKTYGDGDFFGERGIFLKQARAASIIATSTTRVFVIKASDFQALLADPLGKEFEEQIKEYDNMEFDVGKREHFHNLVSCTLDVLQANDLGILGVGSFGRVSLVKDPSTGTTYSLKKVRKNKVIETGQQEHIRNERAVLATLDSAFCVRLFGTYQDELNIYFLMEPVLGGELFTVLRWNKRFSEKTARFYAACVVLAFESLHSKNIIYRDLKPENLLISSNGYCKLVDFGFAKKRNNSCTLCGTPEYLSPEVIQNYSQGFAVDWWALGIFVYEMVVGHAPFQDDPNVKMYEKILTYDVEFPQDPKLTPRVEHLISSLLEKNAYQRLGAGQQSTQQILSHAWFHGLNWDEMRNQKIAPPYVPNIQGQEDLSHYDVYPDENIDEKLNDDVDAYEWCEDF